MTFSTEFAISTQFFNIKWDSKHVFSIMHNLYIIERFIYITKIPYAHVKELNINYTFNFFYIFSFFNMNTIIVTKNDWRDV